MNILYLCDEYPPCQHGGIGTAIQNLAREMSSNGHQVYVCGFYPYYRTALPYEVDHGVKVYRMFYGNWLLLKLSRHKYFGRVVNIERKFKEYTGFIKHLIAQHKIDIIEMPDFNEAFRYSGPRFIKFPDFTVSKIVKLHGSFSYLEHSKEAGSFNKQIYQKEKFHIHSASKVIAVSSFAKEITNKIFGNKNGISIIHNGIDAKDPKVYKGDSGKKIVVFAGRLSEEKGVYSLIKAWGFVVEKIPSAKLLIFGRGDIKTLEKIEKLISNEVRNFIELRGYVTKSELFEVYSTASCAIFPSYFESFSMAPMEAMQVGCPTIFTKRSSGSELITDNINGLLIDPDNIKEISESIIFMLSERPKAIEMGQNGAKTIQEKFNIPSIVHSHILLYSDYIKKTNDQ